MRLFSVEAVCPVCGNAFKADVLADYNIERYDEDFRPVFEKDAKLLKYYIWFCQRCHFAGYDDRFIFKGNNVEYGDAELAKLKAIPRRRIQSLPYRFYRAGQISEALDDPPMNALDYYLKSYWTAKESSKREWINMSSRKIFENAERVYQTTLDDEQIFLSLYLSGYIRMEAGDNEGAALYFSRLIRIKTVPAKYERFVRVALDFIRRYKSES